MEKSEDEKTRSFAFEGDNEHLIVEQQLQQISRARNKASEQWTAQATVLRELVNHHVKEEEDTGFTCARREFDRGAGKARRAVPPPEGKAAGRGLRDPRLGAACILPGLSGPSPLAGSREPSLSGT